MLNTMFNYKSDNKYDTMNNEESGILNQDSQKVLKK